MCDHYKECTKRFDKIDRAFEELNNRLFKGNGKDAWDVRLDRLEVFKKVIIWVICTLIIATASVVGKMIISQ